MGDTMQEDGVGDRVQEGVGSSARPDIPLSAGILLDYHSSLIAPVALNQVLQDQPETPNSLLPS